nr:hypothetical protein [Tanacetum cinerariifolium]
MKLELRWENYQSGDKEPMAKEQDEQQQQNLMDAELIQINKQVENAIRNFRIALEKTQQDVIYKQFWHTIAYDLTAKAHLFIIDNRVFEVDPSLLRKTTAYDRPRLAMLQLL